MKKATDLAVDVFGNQISTAQKEEDYAHNNQKKINGPWQELKAMFGGTTKAELKEQAAKARKEGLMDKAADFEMQMAVLDFMNEYNSPEEIDKRRRSAGHNTNIEGDAPQSVNPMENLPAVPSSALSPEALMGLDNSIMQGFGTIMSMVTGISQIRQIAMNNRSVATTQNAQLYPQVKDFVVNNLLGFESNPEGDVSEMISAFKKQYEGVNVSDTIFGVDSGLNDQQVNAMFMRALDDVTSRSGMYKNVSDFQKSLLGGQFDSMLDVEFNADYMAKYMRNYANSMDLAKVLEGSNALRQIQYNEQFPGGDQALLDAELLQAKGDNVDADTALKEQKKNIMNSAELVANDLYEEFLDMSPAQRMASALALLNSPQLIKLAGDAIGGITRFISDLAVGKFKSAKEAAQRMGETITETWSEDGHTLTKSKTMGANGKGVFDDYEFGGPGL